nr:hypothetical protein [uncultured Desulfuromonas sp.]
MMNPTIGFFVVMATIVCLGLTGCEKEGPAEQAGKKIDETIEQTSEAVDAKGLFEKAGEMVDDAVENVKEGAAEVKEDVSEAIEKHQEQK